ncbi:MAG TPA: MarR family winged helix-turn-helix transcriptional regulator [Chloroflexota bacterium]|nr:MarR family winged helix-turn-helix transcriptional regulator [Chloroflexota bacterium]
MTSDKTRLEAWALFLEAHARLVQTLEAELEAETGLPLTWYDVLAQLSAAPEGRLRMSDLYQSLLLSKSGLTRRIDRMVEVGLVERKGCPGDRRGVFAVLTPKGREILRAAAPLHCAGVERHFGEHIDETELATFRRVLTKIIADLGDGAERQCESALDEGA